MNALSEFATRTLRGLSRLFTLAVLGSFVLGLLLLGIVAALLSVLWSLVRGKRPALFTVFQFFQRASRPFGQRPGAMPPSTPDSAAAGMRWPRSAANADDVVDVQAHEVRPSLGQRPPH